MSYNAALFVQRMNSEMKGRNSSPITVRAAIRRALNALFRDVRDEHVESLYLTIAPEGDLVQDWDALVRAHH